MDLQSSTHYINGWFRFFRKLLKLAMYEFMQHIPGRSLYLHRKWRHQLLPIDIRSHKRGHFGSCSGRDIALTVQPMSKRFKVLERLIQLLHRFLRNSLDMFAPWPPPPKCGSSGPAIVFVVAIFVLLSCSNRTYESAHICTWACIYVWETSDSKHYTRWLFWDECRRISHCPTNWWAYLWFIC